MPRPPIPAACCAAMLLAGPAFAQDGPALPAPPGRPDLAAPPPCPNRGGGKAAPSGRGRFRGRPVPAPNRGGGVRSRSRRRSRRCPGRTACGRAASTPAGSPRTPADPNPTASRGSRDLGPDRDRPLAPRRQRVPIFPAVPAGGGRRRGWRRTGRTGRPSRRTGASPPGSYYDPDRSPVVLGVSGRDTAEGVLITPRAARHAGPVRGAGGGRPGADGRRVPGGRGSSRRPGRGSTRSAGNWPRRLGPTGGGHACWCRTAGPGGSPTSSPAPRPRTGPTDALDPRRRVLRARPPRTRRPPPYGGGLGGGPSGGLGAGPAT